MAELAPHVIDAHRALNTDRRIEPGEWIEVLAIQRVVGAEELLMWQSRATRATVGRSGGITPGYYRACAARQACERYQPQDVAGDRHRPEPPAKAASPDPARDACLAAMGVRDRQALVSVPTELIQAWADVIDHPGLAAPSSPVGFAASQMRQGAAPAAARGQRLG